MEENIDVKQANKTLYLALAVIAILAVAAFTNGFGFFEKGPTGNVIDSSKLEIGDSPVLGNINAPVTIYEFSDFSCPFCAAADGKNQQYVDALKAKDALWQAPIPGMIEEYVETGKAKIVFKYYPGHGSGRAAMIVGYALADQDDSLFWKFHDLAFENQEDTGDIIKMKALAESIGADMAKLNADINSGKYNSYLDRDTALGKSAGVQGTPAFIINGELVVGAQSYSVFKAVIESKL